METTRAAIRPAAKPGMISYRPVPFSRASHRISTPAPQSMPATAPPKVSRRQNRLSSMVGPKAAPNTPQAFSTRPMIVPLLGLEATINAITAMMMTTTRPAHSISLSEATKYPDVIAHLRKIPEIVECHFITGKYAILAKLYCLDNDHLMEVLLNTIQKIPYIQSTDTMISLDEPIERQVWVKDFKSTSYSGRD